MVKTRQRARLEAARRSLAQSEASESSDQDRHDVKTGQDEEKVCAEEAEPSVEELALRAFARMKEHLAKKAITVHADREVEDTGVEAGETRSVESDRPPDLLLLDSKATSSKKTEKGETLKSHRGTLASSLQPGMTKELYFSYSKEAILKSPRGGSRVIGDDDGELMKKSIITADFEKKELVPPASLSRYALQKQRKAEKEKSAGKQWFDLPATPLTPELRNDLKILRIRGALDPTRHYKANDSKGLPKFFQVGQVVSGAAEFYSARIPRRQRKKTIVEELLADEEFRRYHKKKYSELQQKYASGTRRYRNIKHKKKFKK